MTANVLVFQVFAYRASEGELSRVAAATKNDYLLRTPFNDWMSWPPQTIDDDDDGLAVLDDRFVNVLSRKS